MFCETRNQLAASFTNKNNLHWASSMNKKQHATICIKFHEQKRACNKFHEQNQRVTSSMIKISFTRRKRKSICVSRIEKSDATSFRCNKNQHAKIPHSKLSTQQETDFVHETCCLLIFVLRNFLNINFSLFKTWTLIFLIMKLILSI